MTFFNRARLEKAKDFMAWKGLKSVEFRSLYWIYRGFLVFVFLMYLILNGSEAWDWVQIKRVRMQSLAHLEDIVKEGIAQKDLSYAVIWVAARPKEESKEILHVLEPYSGILPTPLFFNFIMRADYLNEDDARKFW